jgi:predicted dehydrogenase
MKARLGQHLPLPRQLLQDWTINPDVAAGRAGHLAAWMWKPPGSGVTGDLLAHCIDTALWINGPIASLIER